MDSDEEYEALRERLFPGERLAYVKLRRHPSAIQARFRELHERRVNKLLVKHKLEEARKTQRAERLKLAAYKQLQWMRAHHPKGTEFSWVDGKWIVGRGTHGKKRKK